VCGRSARLQAKVEGFFGNARPSLSRPKANANLVQMTSALFDTHRVLTLAAFSEVLKTVLKGAVGLSPPWSSWDL